MRPLLLPGSLAFCSGITSFYAFLVLCWFLCGSMTLAVDLITVLEQCGCVVALRCATTVASYVWHRQTDLYSAIDSTARPLGICFELHSIYGICTGIYSAVLRCRLKCASIKCCCSWKDFKGTFVLTRIKNGCLIQNLLCRERLTTLYVRHCSWTAKVPLVFFLNYNIRCHRYINEQCNTA